MKRNRAERRKHKFRIRRKFLNKVKQDDTLYPYLNNKQLKLYVAKWADIQQMCSCSICRNPRHSKLVKGKDKLTVQEKKNIINSKEIKNV